MLLSIGVACDSESVTTTLHAHAIEEPRYWTAVDALGLASVGVMLSAVRETRYVGQPFVLGDDGRPVGEVNAYFGSRLFRSYAESTRDKYSRGVCTWLNFCEARGISWRSASEDDVSDFKFWRMTDQANLKRVVGSTVHGDLAAMSSLYEWLESRTTVVNPVTRVQLRDSTGARRGFVVRGAAKAEPAGVRDRDVKWLDPAGVSRWVDVALRRLDLSGREPERVRSLTGPRDAAYAMLLYGSGLRRSEAGSLLMSELPGGGDVQTYYSVRLASSCAKGGRSRSWWLPRSALDEVQLYLEAGRAEAVQRAVRMGRYPSQGEAPVIEAELGPRRVAVRVDGSRHVVSLDTLTPKQRLGLYRVVDGRIEPAAVWLNGDGRPRPSRAWNATFATGNDRFVRLGLPWFRCTPHMLRHSFALRWYAVARLLWDRRLAHLTDTEQRDFRVQFGDTWSFVQTLLGHAHPQTTADIYLEPFRGLEVELLLECVEDLPLSGLMRAIFARDPRVLHDPVGATGE